jgi:hypothetical protein
MSNAGLVYEDLIGRGRAVATACCWRGNVRRFEACCGVRDDYSRGDVVKYLAQLRSEGIKQNSINMMLKPIKLLCELQGWSDGFPRLAMPKVRRSDINRPRLSIGEVCNIVTRAKEVCSERELAFLAAATIYGLRREEIGTLEVSDGHVTVHTAKGGEVTTHLLPDSIKCYLVGYRGAKDVKYLTRVFWNVVDKVGLSLSAGYGWHSIRRALATELMVCDVSLWNLIKFMRWSDAMLQREVGMLAIYAECKQEDVDRSVFKVHPFLRFW